MGKYQIYLDRAYDAIDQRAYADAMKWCKRALAIDASAPEAHNVRGEALDASGMWEEALAAFDRALACDPHFVEAMLNKAEVLSDRPSTCEQALPLCNEAEALCDEDDDIYLLAEIAYIRGNALQGLFRYREALAQYDRALDLVPNHPEYLYERGVALYCMVDYDEAETCLRASIELDPNYADAHYALGLVCEKTDREENALEHFALATQLDEARHRTVVRVSRKRFEEYLRDAMSAMPERFTRQLEGVVVEVEDFPSRERLLELSLEPQVLGTFEGHGQPATSGATRITLYQRNLEKMCESEDEIPRQINFTLMHEVGHFLGMTEEELQSLGIE